MLFNVTKKKAHHTAKKIFGPHSLVTRTFSTFFGPSVSNIVLPAQKLASDSTYVQATETIEKRFQTRISKEPSLQLDLHEVHCFDGAILETMELAHKEQLAKPKEEQHYVIYLCGNDMCMQDLYDEIRTQCLETRYNFVAFNYKNVMRSQGTIYTELDLIYDVVSQVERLRDEGVALENICIVGHSLGAVFATLTSYTYMKEGTPLKVFNGRSFSNFATMAYLQAKINGTSDLEAMYKKMVLSLSNFEIEVARYYDLIPAQYKDYITVEQKDMEDGSKTGVPDGVIPTEASLAYAVQDQSSTHKVLSTNRLFGFGHNDPLKTLTAHDEDKSAEQLCREFILK